MGQFLKAIKILLVTAAIVGSSVLLYPIVHAHRLRATNMFVSFSTVALLVCLLVLIIRYLFLVWFAFLQHRENMAHFEEMKDLPLVSVIVPAFNEGKVIEAAIKSILTLDYPHFEVLVVDDGSTDDTYRRALHLAENYSQHRIRVFTQPNSGKAAALNHGIAQCSSKYILFMDADSRLETQTLKEAMKHFLDPTVGAVAGNVKVANRLNILTKLQTLEYIEGLSLVRTAHAFFRRVTVIPGPIGLYRREVLDQAGGFASDTYAEDCDLTLRVVLLGWKIKYESRAVAWTEAPETTEALFKQRYRWSRGMLQALLKHKGRLLRPFPDFLDWCLLWALAFDSLIWPLMDVFGILFFVVAGVWGGVSTLIFLWWAQLTILDVITGLFCTALEEEDITLAFYAVLYRLFFVPLVDVIRVFASLDELFGVAMAWGQLERFGRI